jgi:hypothetical protein
MLSSNLLRFALTIDAVASAASAALLLFGAAALTGLLGLPEELMRVAGIILVPFVMLVGYTATRAKPTEGVVWAIIAINIAWVAGSVLLLAGGYVSPTALGTAFVIAQAVAVLIFADLQYFGLRQARKISALA